MAGVGDDTRIKTFPNVFGRLPRTALDGPGVRFARRRGSTTDRFPADATGSSETPREEDLPSVRTPRSIRPRRHRGPRDGRGSVPKRLPLRRSDGGTPGLEPIHPIRRHVRHTTRWARVVGIVSYPTATACSSA
jgi:hypothetical protein